MRLSSLSFPFTRLSLFAVLMVLGSGFYRPAIAQTWLESSGLFDMLLYFSDGQDVKVYRGDRDVTPRYSGMMLRPGDSIQVSPSSGAQVRCPNGKKYETPGRRFGLGEVCTAQRVGSGARSGVEIAWVVNREYKPQTLIAPDRVRLSWPAVPGATTYQIQITHDVTGDTITKTSSDNSLSFDAKEFIKGELYELEVTTPNLPNSPPYRLPMTVLLGNQWQTIQSALEEMNNEPNLSLQDRQDRLLSLMSMVHQFNEKGQLWLAMVGLLEPTADPDHWALQLQLADAYFYLGRFDEAREVAQRVANQVEDGSLERAIAQEILGKVTIWLTEEDQELRRAITLYEQAGAPDLAETIRGALRR